VIESNKQAVFCVEVSEPDRIKKLLQQEGFTLLEEELYEF